MIQFVLYMIFQTLWSIREDIAYLGSVLSLVKMLKSQENDVQRHHLFRLLNRKVRDSICAAVLVHNSVDMSVDPVSVAMPVPATEDQCVRLLSAREGTYTYTIIRNMIITRELTLAIREMKEHYQHILWNKKKGFNQKYKMKYLADNDRYTENGLFYRDSFTIT